MNVKQLISWLVNSPVETAELIKGNHGLGKSQIVKQAVLKTRALMPGVEVGFIDKRLSQEDVGDLKGLPYEWAGHTHFAPPDWFPIHPEDVSWLQKRLKASGKDFQPLNTATHGILFLDEFNHATKEVSFAAFELVLDRRLNGIRLPDGWRVVAAINSDTDLYDVTEMHAALADRFHHIDFKPTDAEWFEWARNGTKFDLEGNEIPVIHDAVIQFLTMKPDKLDALPEEIRKSVQTGNKTQSRRSWEKLSDAIVKYERMARNNPGDPFVTDLLDPKNEEFLVIAAAGYLGAGLAVDFAGFVKSKYRVLSPKKVLNAWGKDIEDHIAHFTVFEGSDFVKGLLAELAKTHKGGKKLTDKQGENLEKFIKLCYAAEVRDPLADFWVEYSKGDTREGALEWFAKHNEARALLAKCINRPATLTGK